MLGGGVGRSGGRPAAQAVVVAPPHAAPALALMLRILLLSGVSFSLLWPEALSLYSPIQMPHAM